ncbi:DUF6350 family protein [Microbacterium cremeum]|uniref:cell division protein PerM n=1 Tax=Microbacterium cremeum TaxID=2782169 RepID=UPI0018882993|nr:DUF6350 family protein [Microbacterium cremeum]
MIAVGIAAVSAALAAALAAFASGSLGPERLAVVGPEPGPVALAVGAEVLLGAAILLMSPGARRTRTSRSGPEPDAQAGPRHPEPSTATPSPLPPSLSEGTSASPSPSAAGASDGVSSEARTEPIELPRVD